MPREKIGTYADGTEAFVGQDDPVVATGTNNPSTQNTSPSGYSAPTNSSIVGTSDPFRSGISDLNKSIQDMYTKNLTSLSDVQGLKDTAVQNNKTIEDYRKVLAEQFENTKTSINSEYAKKEQVIRGKQANETGATSMGLARIGGYLGAGTAAEGNLKNLDVIHGQEINALNSAKDAAIQSAYNSYNDKNYVAAKEQIDIAKNLETEINNRKQKFSEMTVQYMQEMRAQDKANQEAETAKLKLDQQMNSPFGAVDEKTQTFLYDMISKYGIDILPEDTISTITDKIKKSDIYKSDLLKAQQKDTNALTLKDKIDLAQKMVASGQAGNLQDALSQLEGGFGTTGMNQTGGMRTDRHNNPTAMIWTPNVEAQFKQMGYDVKKGDSFKGGDGSTYYTLDMNGVSDPIEATISYIDKNGFFTQSGNQRWSHTAISQNEWSSLSNEDKRNVVNQMYQKEGGSGVLGVSGMNKKEQEAYSKIQDPLDQQIWASSTSKIRSNAMALVDGSLQLNAISKRNGENTNSFRLAQAIDPTFSQAVSDARYKYYQKFSAGPPSDNRQAINTAIQHLTELKKTFDKLQNKKFGGFLGMGTKSYNYVKNILAEQSGDPDVKKFQYEINQVATEIAKVYKGNASPTEKEIEENRSAISSSMSNEQMSGIVQAAAELLAGKLSSVREDYRNVMGKELPFNLINDESRKTLQTIGLDPEHLDPTIKKIEDSTVDNETLFNQYLPKN